MKNFAVMSVVVGLVALLVAGCAGTAKGPTDEEMITQRIQEGVAAIKAKNIDAFAGMMSATFSSSEVGDKDGLLAYLKNADSMGFLDGIEVDFSGSKTVIDGDKATVGPVVATGGFGSITLNFEGVKQNGIWVISGLEPGY